MQICRFCGKLIQTEKPYDPGELWICKACEDEHKKKNEELAKRLERIREEGKNEDLQEGVSGIQPAEEDPAGPGRSCSQTEEAAGSARAEVPAPGEPQEGKVRKECPKGFR